jgi:mannose-1-phosphate guanylyltransferase
VTEAILLVGGLGTRLRPLTDHTPKPLLPVAGVPFVLHQVARAAAAGVKRVVLATSYRSDAFVAQLLEAADRFDGLDLVPVVEDEPLGTGGAIRHAADVLTSGPDDPVFVFNGDVLDGHDLAAQLARHLDWQADATLYLTEVEDPRAFGSVPTDDRGRVTAFLEKSPDPVTNQVNAGCYVFRRRVIDEIPDWQAVSVERETFPALLAAGRLVLGHLDRAYWTDLGTPDAYIQGSADLVRGLIAPSARPGPPGEALVLPGAQVHPTARVFRGSSILPGAVVGANAVVEASVVMADAKVGEGATVVHSAVGRGAQVGDGARISHSVVGDDAVVGARNELRAGARVQSGAVLAAACLRFS